MNFAEQIYARTPWYLQNLACSLEGWRIRRTRYGAQFWPLLEESYERTFWPRDRVQDFRDERLRAFVLYAARTTPHYRELFRTNGVDPVSIRGLDDLARLPILAKREVQVRTAEFVSQEMDPRFVSVAHTSGTTGAGLRFPVTQAAEQEQWAIWWRYRRWHGIAVDTWCGYFGGRSVVPLRQRKPPFWRYNHPGRQLFFSGYHMSRENLDAYVLELRRSRPPWLHGYPSLLALLAGHVVETGNELGYAVRWITTGSENLLPQQRALIEKAFGVAPRQHYGMAEGVANISECELGTLHVDEDFSAVEFVPTDGGYCVVGCNFANLATPLLRYDVGDVVGGVGGSCSCGRPGRVVHTIDGRKEDYVVLRNGARIGRMDHIFKDMVAVVEAQIHQREPGVLEFRIVRAPSYTATDEAMLLREARQRVGEDTRIDIVYAERLHRSSTGKLRFVLSELREAQVDAIPGEPRPLSTRTGTDGS